MYDDEVTLEDVTFVKSTLEICSIEFGEGGVYTCNATSGFIDKINTIIINVTYDGEWVPGVYVWVT